MKYFILILLVVSSCANAQNFIGSGINTTDTTSEQYVNNSPTNSQNNRRVVTKMRDSLYIKWGFNNVYFNCMNASVNNGTPLNMMWYGMDGKLSGTPLTSVPLSAFNNDAGFIGASGAAINLTTTGSSGASSWNSGTRTLNVPSYTTAATTLTGDITGTGTGSFATTLAATGTAGTYGVVTTDSKGRVTAGKRQELYSGTTNGSGVYTVTFGTPYSVAPNIQTSLTNQSLTNQYTRISSISTTGFTINAYSFNSNNLLGIISLITTTSNIVGAAVDVLVTEK